MNNRMIFELVHILFEVSQQSLGLPSQALHLQQAEIQTMVSAHVCIRKVEFIEDLKM